MEHNNITDNKYPLLSKIDSPADLRKVPEEKLPDVCAELRKFLIDHLSENPGHFASNMGSVELTVALHYVFNTPYDRIVWDVGHQAYGHKVLTGRRDRFKTNRKLNGLSGFPFPDESEYDTFAAGHASNSISAALGMAIASSLNKDKQRRNVIAVIGDASIGGGLAFEGLNNVASSQNNLLIILNDNDMSIDHNVGSLNQSLVKINTSKSYNRIRFKVYKALRKLHLIDDKHRGIILRFNNSLKSLISRQQNIFEGLNIRYFGPYDGHDIERLVRVFNDIKDMDGPRILHLRTTKGKGYEPAEKNPTLWHAPGKFNKETGELRTLGEGTVGVRIGLNSIIAVNKDKTFKYVFKGDAEIQEEIAEIQAKMNRSMVANNPDNYNEDGTAKKGRRKWVRSNRYFKLRNRMRELRRISIVRRRIEYHEVANIIAQMGESFVINKIDFKNLQERKPLEQNPDGSCKSRKNQGEKIRAHAPAEMVSYLVTRITSLNGQVSYVNEKDLKLNTYDHISGKHERTPEINQLDPKVYYAFLLSNIRGGKVDRKECETSFQAWRNNISA